MRAAKQKTVPSPLIMGIRLLPMAVATTLLFEGICYQLEWFGRGPRRHTRKYRGEPPKS